MVARNIIEGISLHRSDRIIIDEHVGDSVACGGGDGERLATPLRQDHGTRRIDGTVGGGGCADEIIIDTTAPSASASTSTG